MKKITLMCLAVLFISGTANSAINHAEKASEAVATVSISGQVLDHLTGEALAGVKVKVDETETISYTDFEGNFTINGLRPASYTVLVSMISYEEASLPVQADLSENIDFLKVKLEQVRE
jgi:hypothetical protein